jgi:hypothetical protein
MYFDEYKAYTEALDKADAIFRMYGEGPLYDEAQSKADDAWDTYWELTQYGRYVGYDL